MLADRHADTRLVAVARREPAAVVDQGEVAVSAVPAGHDDDPVAGRLDRRSRGGSDVDAGVKAVPAQHRVVSVAERAGDGAVHGPAEPVVPGRRVAAAHAGRDLRLDRVVLRLEIGLAGT